MSKGSRAKHAQVEFSPEDDQDDEPDNPMCSQCGFFVKLATRDICECCESMETPNPRSFA